MKKVNTDIKHVWETQQEEMNRQRKHFLKKGVHIQTAESTLLFSTSLFFLWFVLLFLLLCGRSLRLRFALFGRLLVGTRLALFGRAGLRIHGAVGLSLLFGFLVMFLLGSPSVGSWFHRRGRLVPRRLQNRLRSLFTLLGLRQKTLLLFLALLLLRVLVGFRLFNFWLPGNEDVNIKVNSVRLISFEKKNPIH